MTVTPESTKGRVLDALTERPLAGAEVHAGDVTAVTSDDGSFSISGIGPSTPISVTHTGYLPAAASAAGDVLVRLRPQQISGIVTDSRNGRPLPGARLYYSGTVVISDATGGFTLAAPEPEGEVKIKLPGYRKTTVRLGRSPTLGVQLEPFDVRGLYLTHYTLGWGERREQLFELVKQSELNAVVLDVKGDRGRLSYRSNVPLAKELGAEEVMIDDIGALLKRLKDAKIYTIARIVVFKDDVLATKRPELAVKLRSGQPYVDFEDLKWVDPFRREVWEYNIQLAEEAAKLGFDEIQFDYIRFPSDGAGGLVYSQESTEASRVGAITGFARAANERLQPLGAFVAVDTFGWTMFMPDDIGIGQQLESLAPHVDFVCPMVYPSGWDAGSEGVADPVAQPYDIVFLSTKRGIERTAGIPTVRIRPWIQDFNDYGPSKKPYGEPEVRAQIQASRDAGAPGWLLWDAAATYTAAAVDSEANAAPPVDWRPPVTTTQAVTATTPITPTAPVTPTNAVTPTAPVTATAPLTRTGGLTSSATVTATAPLTGAAPLTRTTAPTGTAPPTGTTRPTGTIPTTATTPTGRP